MRLTRHPQPPCGAPLGQSLLATLVALITCAALSTLTFSLVSHNQRALRGHARLLESRAPLWQGHHVLAAELQTLAMGAGDLLARSDSAVTFRGFVAAGVVCEVAGPSTVAIPPDSLASGSTLTSAVSAIRRGDEIFILDEGLQDGAADDRWWQAQITGTATAMDPCPRSALVDSVLDRGKRGSVLALSASLPQTVRAGAPLHVTRLARLALYRSSADWFLGFADWNATSQQWNTIQPITGPFRRYVVNGPTGLAFEYRDSLGAPVNASVANTTVAAIGVMLRTETRGAFSLPGMPRGRHVDSLHTIIAPRNFR